MMKGNDRYQIAGMTCTIDGRTYPVANLSVGGFFVETPDPLAVGRVVQALLGLKEGLAFEVTAKVAWVNSNARPRVAHLPPGYGLKMQRVAFADRMAIVRVLSEAGIRTTRARPRQPAA